MLRAAIKHGISKALSSGAGFEVWDFEIREEQPTPDRVTVEIRYRYQPNLFFTAAIVARGAEGKVPTYEITAEAVPGEVGERDALSLQGREELCKAIERWTTRIEEELSARPSNRVLAAQQKAIAYLEKHLLDIPDQGLTRERIIEYRRRLERLEAAVIEIKAQKGDRPNGTRAEEVREEFSCLRRRLEVLGERSFLHAVLVRLVKYFWDDENLRIIEAGSRAAQDFLKDEDHPLSLQAKPETAATRAASRPELPPAARTPVPRPDASAATRALPKAETPRAAPKAEAAQRAMPKADPPAARPSPKPAVAVKPEAAPRAPAKPDPLGGRPRVKPEPQIKAKLDAPAPQAPAAEPAPQAAPERQRAAYKPLRPNRG